MADLITPPPELTHQWRQDWISSDSNSELASYIATAAAQWGADQELEACCEWTTVWISAPEASQLYAARRPKPLSEADQALADLDALVDDLSNHGMGFKTTNLRRALERLKELEGQCNG